MRSIFLLLTLLTVLTTSLLCQQADNSNKPLTNQDVVSMVRSGLPENVIVAAIQANDTNFDVSAKALIALKESGVTPKVMETMLGSSAKKNPSGMKQPDQPASANAPASSSPDAPAWQPTVAYLTGKTKHSLAAEATQIVSSKVKPTSLAAMAADAALDQALQVGSQVAQNALLRSGSAAGATALGSTTNVIGTVFGWRKQQAQQQQKTTYVWALNGGSAATSVGGNAAVFDVVYSGLPGVKPEEFQPVIVKLAPTPQANFRLVGATEGALNAGQDPQHDWPIYSSFVEDRMAATVEKLALGHARIVPTAALPSGQYAVALRPIDRGHKFSGEEVGKNQGEGLLFNYAWSFAVN